GDGVVPTRLASVHAFGYGAHDRSLAFHSAIDAEGTGSVGEEREENETVEHRRLAPVLNGEKSSRQVRHEVGYRHFARQDKGARPGEEPEYDQQSAESLQDSRQAH